MLWKMEDRSPASGIIGRKIGLPRLFPSRKLNQSSPFQTMKVVGGLKPIHEGIREGKGNDGTGENRACHDYKPGVHTG